VCLPVLNPVDSKGIRGKILNKLTDEEVQKPKLSAAKLCQVIEQIEY